MKDKINAYIEKAYRPESPLIWTVNGRIMTCEFENSAYSYLAIYRTDETTVQIYQLVQTHELEIHRS